MIYRLRLFWLSGLVFIPDQSKFMFIIDLLPKMANMGPYYTIPNIIAKGCNFFYFS